MPEQGEEGDKTPKAMPQHHLGTDWQGGHGDTIHHPRRRASALGVMASLLSQEEGEVIHEGPDAHRIAPSAARATEAPVIHAGDSPAQPMQPMGRVAIPLTMLAVAVRDHHAALGGGMLPPRPGQGHSPMAGQDPTDGGLQIGGDHGDESRHPFRIAWGRNMPDCFKLKGSPADGPEMPTMDFETLVRAKNELEPRVQQLVAHLDPERKALELEQIEEKNHGAGLLG